MQGIHGRSWRTRTVQLPLSISSRVQLLVAFRALSHPSLWARSRRVAVPLLSCVHAWQWRSVGSGCRDRQSLPSSSSPFFEQEHRPSLEKWRRTTTRAFQNRSPPAIMSTLSIAAHEGGRQLRRRKETHIPVASTTQGLDSTVDSNQNRKKPFKAAVSSSPTEDDDVEPVYSGGESVATDLEARLWNLDKSDQLTSLTVVELRGLMKHISKPTAGRKDELISEVKKWLAERQAFATQQTKLDGNRATRESSSDAESLEGALLKAEKKSRQSTALSRMTETSAGIGLREMLTEKQQPSKQEPEKEKDNSLVNGEGISAPKAPRGGAAQRRKAVNARNGPGGKGSDKDSEPTVEEDVGAVKSQATRKGNKADRNLDESMEDVVVKTAVVVIKRKTQASKSTQSKKQKVIVEEEATLSVTSAVSKEPWTMLVHKKPQKEWVVYNPDAMRPAPPSSGTATMKIISWNVNGLRALVKDKEKKHEALLLKKLAEEEEFDVLCLQETKLQDKDVEQLSKVLPDYDDRFWSCSTSKLGYSGTAVLSKVKPVSVKFGMGILDHDSEGRLITVEFDTFFLLTSYVPNAGEKLVRLTYRTEEWDPALSQYIKELETQKPVILTGDLNCCNEEIDIHNPDGNRKSAGFTDEERKSFKDNFLDKGLVDTFRRQHANAVAYTYWGYRFASRSKNQGWRLDYFLASEALVDRVHDSYIRPDVLGSDHCPIGLILQL